MSLLSFKVWKELLIEFIPIFDDSDDVCVETFIVPSWYIFSGVTFRILKTPGRSWS